MSYYRNISSTYNDSCVIPRPLDKLYCELKKQEEDSVDIVKLCGSHVQNPFDFLSNTNLTDGYSSKQRRFCLRDLGGRVRSSKEHGNCPILKNCLYFEQCYCNDREMENQYNGTIQCICDLLAVGGDNCTSKPSVPNRFYVRHNCTINGMKERALPNITECTLHDGPYPFEDSYFSSLECPREHTAMFARQTSSVASINQISLFLPLSILLVHLLMLTMIFRREKNQAERRKKLIDANVK